MLLVLQRLGNAFTVSS